MAPEQALCLGASPRAAAMNAARSGFEQAGRETRAARLRSDEAAWTRSRRLRLAMGQALSMAPPSCTPQAAG